MPGRRSRAREKGGQGTLASQRSDMAKAEKAERELEVRQLLQDSQTTEAQRRARKFLPDDVTYLQKLIRSKDTPPNVKVNGIKLMREIAKGESTGGGKNPANMGKAAGGVSINFITVGDDTVTIPARAMPSKHVPELPEGDVDADP